MTSIVTTSTLPEAARNEAACLLVDVGNSVALPVALTLEWLRPDDGDRDGLPAVNVNIAGKFGLIARDYPSTIFLAEDAYRAPYGLAGAIAHEVAHAAQVLGWCPTGGDHEVRAKIFEHDFGNAHLDNPNASLPFAALFEDDHPRAQFYRDVRDRKYALGGLLAWDRQGFWGEAVVPPPPPAPSTPASRPASHHNANVSLTEAANSLARVTRGRGLAFGIANPQTRMRLPRAMGRVT